QLYDRVTSPESAPIILLYGQSGVGKSSFLDAGLVPRLRRDHEIRYLRRDARSSLLSTLRDSLAGSAKTDLPLDECWRVVEQKSGKPLVAVFDQIEEVYTQPNQQHLNEFAEFFGEIGKTFGEPARRPQGRLILSFRKEWYPEIQKQMEVNDLEYTKVFLETLDRDGILDAVTGLANTTRLRDRYGLSVQPGLPEIIADELSADRGSPIAPTLQILLTKLWAKARAQND